MFQMLIMTQIKAIWAMKVTNRRIKRVIRVQLSRQRHLIVVVVTIIVVVVVVVINMRVLLVLLLLVHLMQC